MTNLNGHNYFVDEKKHDNAGLSKEHIIARLQWYYDFLLLSHNLSCEALEIDELDETTREMQECERDFTRKSLDMFLTAFDKVLYLWEGDGES